MKAPRLPLAAAFALSLNLALVGVSAAQGSDTDAPGRQVAHQMFTAMDFADLATWRSR